jgi:hypothetical protein
MITEHGYVATWPTQRRGITSVFSVGESVYGKRGMYRYETIQILHFDEEKTAISLALLEAVLERSKT